MSSFQLRLKSFLDFIQLSLFSRHHSIFRTRVRCNQLVRKRENQSEEMLHLGFFSISGNHSLYQPARGFILTLYLPPHEETLKTLKSSIESQNTLPPKISVIELSSASLFPLVLPRSSCIQRPSYFLGFPRSSHPSLSIARKYTVVFSISFILSLSIRLDIHGSHALFYSTTGYQKRIPVKIPSQ